MDLAIWPLSESLLLLKYCHHYWLVVLKLLVCNTGMNTYH